MCSRRFPDRVLLWNGGGEASGQRDTILARLDNMWEDCCSVMWVELTWYYFPEELHCGRLAAHGDKEVFESHTSDETEIASVLRKVKVLSKEEFDALPEKERSQDDVYFCRYHYDPNRQKFMPVIQCLKKASLGALQSFKAQGKDRLLAFPDVLGSHKRTRSRTAAALDPPDHEAEAMGEETGTHEEGVVEFKSKFDKANHALQLSTVPSTMPCR